MVRRFVLVLLLVMPAAVLVAPSTSSAVTPVRVMPLGDSITFGVGTTPYDAYRRDLWGRLRNVGVPVDFVGSLTSGTAPDKNHEGHIGWRIDQISARINGWMATYKPDVVLLHIGTNDIGQNYDMARAPARLSLLIDRILAARPGVRVFVARIIYMTRGGDRYTRYIDAIPGVVASKGPNVHLVPQHIVGRTAGDLVDSAHPSACGYAKMSYVWYYAMGRTRMNTTGRSWPTGYYPFNTRTGPCARR